jgi:hypothetical protein
MHYSLRHPPKGIPLLHVLLWPWIWAQLAALKLWVRAHYGRGVPYWVEVSPLGRVRLRRMPMDLTRGQAAGAPQLAPGFTFTTALTRPALRAALTAEDPPRAPAPVRRAGTIALPAAPFPAAPAPDTS